jgi:hypothetical protein
MATMEGHLRDFFPERDEESLLRDLIDDASFPGWSWSPSYRGVMSEPDSSGVDSRDSSIESLAEFFGTTWSARSGDLSGSDMIWGEDGVAPSSCALGRDGKMIGAVEIDEQPKRLDDSFKPLAL